MNNDLIVVKQLPIIEEQLKTIKASVESRVQSVLSMECTEETRKEVKAARSELNKEFEELERRRKEVKKAIMAPYENFERMYKECAGDIYKRADEELRQKIIAVEGEMRERKYSEIIKYFDEYSASVGIDIEDPAFCYARAGIPIKISDSVKSLKGRCRTFLDHIAADLKAIDSMEDCDEIRYEYRKELDLPTAISNVKQRKKEIEAERSREKPETTEAEKKVLDIIAPPTIKEKTYSTVFRVTGTIEQLRELKRFLNERGMKYEQPDSSEATA